MKGNAMLGRKNYTREEIDQGKAVLDQQLAAYKILVKAVASATKDENPLNEVRIICDSLMNNSGVLRGDKQIKLTPERSIVKLHIGDPIRLTEEEFERLSAAFFAELERRFL